MSPLRPLQSQLSSKLSHPTLSSCPPSLVPIFHKKRINNRGFASTARRQADFTHAVIGGGAVGLAIARKLQMEGRERGRESTSTVLIERNGGVGMETSSRNSEVIHAGLYYGLDSLKTKLCVSGKEMMYDLCMKNNIPFARTKKWIVAQTDEQYEELCKIYEFSNKKLGVPTEFVSLETAAKLEPSVCAKKGILESPTTGIIDSHSYMQFLHQSFTDLGGDTALHSPVIAIKPLGNRGSGGWEITTKDQASGEITTIVAETIINSAGLGACDINNMIVPKEQHRTQYYAKGNYFSYSAPHPRTKHLIYPAPEPGLGGLGTHLTLDISGNIRFGPDIEWVDDPTNLAVNDAQLPQAIKQIQRFLPEVRVESIQPDYAGIRPKLARAGAVAAGKGFQDFYIVKEGGFEGWVNLMGIESPGLTSSLAIGEMVKGLLYKS